MKKRETLCDVEFWLYTIGLIQIFNTVVQHSLAAQYEHSFASTALFLVQEAYSKIQQLGMYDNKNITIGFDKCYFRSTVGMG